MIRLDRRQKIHDKFTNEVLRRMDEKKADSAASLNNSKILKQKSDQYNTKTGILQVKNFFS